MPHDPRIPRGGPRRILVAGTSGSGKSTLARRIAAASALPYQEIDELKHGADWQPRPSFLDEVDAFTRQTEWVIEWQYTEAKPMLAERATSLVFLDYPRRIVMARVVRRTVRRRLRRVELWNGNREAPLGTIFSDRDHIVRWAWRTHPTWRAQVAGAAARHPALEIVRLANPREAELWLARYAEAVGASTAPPKRRLRDA